NIQSQGVAKQKGLYAAAGDQVIDVYSQGKLKKLTADDIKQNMTNKIYELGPSKVSKHVADHNVLNVVDISPGSVSNRGAFENVVRTTSEVSKFLTPPSDPAYHLEI